MLSCKVLGEVFDLSLVVLFGVLYSLRRFVISRQASSVKFWGNLFLFQLASFQGYLVPCSFLKLSVVLVKGALVFSVA